MLRPSSDSRDKVVRCEFGRRRDRVEHPQKPRDPPWIPGLTCAFHLAESARNSQPEFNEATGREWRASVPAECR